MTDYTGTNGDDNITANSGKIDDTIKSGDGNDTINAGDGNDQATGGEGADFIRGGGGEDTVAGFDANDIISGGGANDNLNAGAGNDLINAGKGDDRVAGGEGSDVIMGGEGADTFVFTGKFMDAGDVDYIKDFSVSQSDSFDFSGCSVIGISVENLADKKFGDFSLDNQAGLNDLKVTIELADGSGTQDVWLLDVVNSSENLAFWTSYFGL
jgi:Ca2+-binding RTX toxin-like protein